MGNTRRQGLAGVRRRVPIGGRIPDRFIGFYPTSVHRLERKVTMQKKRFVIAIAFITGCATTVLFSWAFLRGTSQSIEKAVSTDSEESGKRSIVGESGQGEVQRLRAELQRKDLALRAAAIVPVGSDTGPAPQTEDAPSVPVQDPIAMACDLLDERMLTAPVDNRKSAEMEQAIFGMLQASAIPSNIVASTHCGSTLCKVVLRNSTASELESALRKVSENTPKLFGGVSAYNSNPDEKSVYFAKDGKDVQSAPPEEVSAIQRTVVPQPQEMPAIAQTSKAAPAR